MRTCVGCRRRRPQAELTRIVRGPDGRVAIGRTLPGRGAWLCAGSEQCFDRALRVGALARALRVQSGRGEIEELRTGFVKSAPAARD